MEISDYQNLSDILNNNVSLAIKPHKRAKISVFPVKNAKYT